MCYNKFVDDVVDVVVFKVYVERAKIATHTHTYIFPPFDNIPRFSRECFLSDEI